VALSSLRTFSRLVNALVTDEPALISLLRECWLRQLRSED